MCRVDRPGAIGLYTRAGSHDAIGCYKHDSAANATGLTNRIVFVTSAAATAQKHAVIGRRIALC